VKPKRKPAEWRSPCGRTTTRTSGPPGANFTEPPDADPLSGGVGGRAGDCSPYPDLLSLVSEGAALSVPYSASLYFSLLRSCVFVTVERASAALLHLRGAWRRGAALLPLIIRPLRSSFAVLDLPLLHLLTLRILLPAHFSSSRCCFCSKPGLTREEFEAARWRTVFEVRPLVAGASPDDRFPSGFERTGFRWRAVSAVYQDDCLLLVFERTIRTAMSASFRPGCGRGICGVVWRQLSGRPWFTEASKVRCWRLLMLRLSTSWRYVLTDPLSISRTSD